MDPLLRLRPVIATKYHAAWPSLPSSPLGFSKGPLHRDIARSQDGIHRRVRDALERNSLIEEETTINFGHRDESPTVLVYTKWHDDKEWKRAVEEMVASVAKDFPSAIDGGLHFEMTSPQSLKMAYPKDDDSPWKKDFIAGYCHVPALEPYDPEEVSTSMPSEARMSSHKRPRATGASLVVYIENINNDNQITDFETFVTAAGFSGTFFWPETKSPIDRYHDGCCWVQFQSEVDATRAPAVLDNATFMGMNIVTRSVTVNFLRESTGSYDKGSHLIKDVPISCKQKHPHMQHDSHKPPQELINDKVKLENTDENSIMNLPDKSIPQIAKDDKMRQPWFYVERLNPDSKRREFKRIALSQLDLHDIWSADNPTGDTTAMFARGIQMSGLTTRVQVGEEPPHGARFIALFGAKSSGHSMYWEPGRLLGHDNKARVLVSHSPTFLTPVDAGSEYSSGTCHSHIPIYRRPRSVGLGWGGYDLYNEWQYLRRQAKKYVPERDYPTRSAASNVSFTSEVTGVHTVSIGSRTIKPWENIGQDRSLWMEINQKEDRMDNALPPRIKRK
ncbi:hypothetical protein FGRA07_09032 [Fusarium graminearum]|nr:hypothetical protein FGRA07_09032 [Fusarium graminearum]